MTTRTHDNTHRLRKFLDHVAFVAKTYINSEPETYNQAKSHAHWVKAMNKEHEALLSNRTWELVPSSPEQNVVGYKWVFKIKKWADGLLECYKACFVAKGFRQEEGINYFESFVPVVCPNQSHLWSQAKSLCMVSCSKPRSHLARVQGISIRPSSGKYRREGSSLVYHVRLIVSYCNRQYVNMVVRLGNSC